jgi:hypothetical protein
MYDHHGKIVITLQPGSLLLCGYSGSEKRLQGRAALPAL